MKVKVFIETTDLMRAAQKRYFTGGRKQADLIEAKRLEKLVDMALAEGVETDEPTASIPMFDDEHRIWGWNDDIAVDNELRDESDAGDLMERLP